MDGIMQNVTATSGVVLPEPESTAEVGGRRRRPSPALMARTIWLGCPPAAFAAAAAGPAEPFRLRVAMIPVVVAVVGVIAVGLISRRLSADLASGIGAGLFGGWVAYTLRVALHGTPFGFDGLSGDAGRMAAMANRYASTWRSSSGIVPSVPTHYPPLFPWLVGRVSALTRVPAWRLLGPAEAVTLSFVVVAGYLLWRRMLPGPLALVYIGGQSAGAILGAAALSFWGPWAHATDNAATLPGPSGVWLAAGGEALATCCLIVGLFLFIGHRRLRRFTPALFPALYAVLVWWEAPLSGTSTNPARTLGPDLVTHIWTGWWVYLIGPIVGTLVALTLLNRLMPWLHSEIETAKLYHFRHDPYGVFHHGSVPGADPSAAACRRTWGRKPGTR